MEGPYIRRIHFPLIILLALAAAVRLFFLFDGHAIWWDSAVYAGMGKSIFSLGQIGLWEPIRPLVWPTVLGFFWSAKVDVLAAGNFLQICLSVASIYLVYEISRIVFGGRTALLAATIFSFSPIFFFMEYRNYVEIPALFFLLVSVWMILKKNDLVAGVFLGLSLVTKFTMLVFIVPLIIYFVVNGKLKKAIFFSLGSAIFLVPFLVFNLIYYGSAIFPFVEANRVIHQVAGCNVVNYQPWHFYFRMILSENLLYLLLPIGLLISLRKFNNQKFLLLLSLLVPFAYLLSLNCREYRYMIIFLPFAGVFAAYCLYRLTIRLNNRLFFVVVAAVLLISSVLAINFYGKNEAVPEAQEFFQYVSGKDFNAEIWTSNPIVALHSEKKLGLMYYPVYNAELAKNFRNYIIDHADNIGYVFIDSCGGGMTCVDAQCSYESEQLVRILVANFETAYNKSLEGCNYLIFHNPMAG